MMNDYSLKRGNTFFNNPQNFNLVRTIFKFLKIHERIRLGCITRIMKNYILNLYSKEVNFILK
jgi:hypothetical protein